MTHELRLAGIVGSLRAGSVNRLVMQAASTLLPPGVTLDEVPVSAVPMYDGDLEAAGEPAAVADLKRAVTGAHGLVIFTPEYNISIPALVKNTIDWLSRPHGAGAISAVPVGVVAASPGKRAGVGVRGHLTDILGIICPGFHHETLGLGDIHASLGDHGLGGDAADELRRWLAGFVDHAAAFGPGGDAA